MAAVALYSTRRLVAGNTAQNLYTAHGFFTAEVSMVESSVERREYVGSNLIDAVLSTKKITPGHGCPG